MVQASNKETVAIYCECIKYDQRREEEVINKIHAKRWTPLKKFGNHGSQSSSFTRIKLADKFLRLLVASSECRPDTKLVKGLDFSYYSVGFYEMGVKIKV